MKAATLTRNGEADWQFQGEALEDPQLVLWFASAEMTGLAETFARLRARFPAAVIAGATASGEIANGELLENVAVAAALRFRTARIKPVCLPTGPDEQAAALGRQVVQHLLDDELRAVYLLVDGPVIAGPLIAGIVEVLPKGIPVTGGVAAAMDFSVPTGVGLNTPLEPGKVVAIGFYGRSLEVGYGVGSGWDPLGPARQVTRSEGNVIYELDGHPALDLYLRFIGETPSGARLNALRYPFVFKASPDAAQDVIRTLHSIDEQARSLTFVDAVPKGYIAQMMRSMPDRLVDGGIFAARQARKRLGGDPALALVVSCIGRKWVMGQTVSDEITAIGDELRGIPTAGFFSFGEISVHDRSGCCTLYNESVTITLLGEAD